MRFPFNPLWKEKYPISWCELCETATIVHDGCPNHGSSCNGAGCTDCSDDTTEFNKSKTRVEDYLTEEEKKIWRKGLRIKHFIVESLAKGESEINWEKMDKNGDLSENDCQLFLGRSSKYESI